MASIDSRGACPFSQSLPETETLDANVRLELPRSKSVVAQYAVNDEGVRELRLYHGVKEISFDEPDLFAFGERLAKQTVFRAGDAAGWGEGYEWPRVRALLEQLIEEGVLRRAAGDADAQSPAIDRARPSPLPPASCPHARDWMDAEAITRELAGRAVEPGYLELFIPIFRVAHPALDGDGRHVGEANVFPRGMRTETPIEWMACTYPGTRYLADKPMNVTALKAMREHWRQMMAALLRVRGAFLARFPQAREGWSVGHVERLATAVLCVPTYQLMRGDAPVKNGELHPALSSLFRVTDGLRMVMHQMLFVPIGEPTKSPDDPVDVGMIHDYAERNYSFFSDTGVCAGPSHMVREFLEVLVDGAHAERYEQFDFDPPVASALADADKAIDYALLGLQAYAATFSLWPLMTRTYEKLANSAAAAVRDGHEGFAAFNARMAAHMEKLNESPFLATEKWRSDRDGVYADMYEQCGRGVTNGRPVKALAELIAPVRSPAIEIARAELRGHLSRELAGRDVQVDSLVEDIIEYVARTQAILREAVATQAEINRFLGRAAPKRPFAAGDMDVHNLLQGAESRRLPYLLDELSAAFGLEFRIDANSVEITSLSTGAHGALDHSISAGSSPVEKAASHDARSWSQA